MKLCIKLPTYGRPERLLGLLPEYFQLLSGRVDVQFVVTCNRDDLTMNCQAVRQQLAEFPRLVLCFGQLSGKIAAYNAHAQVCPDWDILLVASDDMVPQRKDYDELVVERMQASFPDTDGTLHFNDGFTGNVVNTLPILGRRYYDHFGYVYHGSYRSFWADNEYTEVARALGRLAYFDDVIIRHEHYQNTGGPPDDVYLRSEQAWIADHLNYLRRKANYFDLMRLLKS
jgi:hypothetical protein